ncbi:phage tail protein [Luteolibacter sp. GHJ8]|uniref:Phage tail protein n=1 Tax=Luteolibacter rhizosphaerae TaxID=2989719 RepID=A0ABT3GC77_9BACT|nr:phage tail protein [Luteolibacter rhizosphaerae]MCW1917069.1 phage tail protein [Luteolibacter rhizosphaerae]
MGVIGGIVAGIASFLGASGAVASAIGFAVNLGIAAFSISSSLGAAKEQRQAAERARLDSIQRNAFRNFRQPLTPRRIVFGTCRVAGPLVFAHNRKLHGTHLVVALAGHEVEAIDSVWLLEDELVYQKTGPNLGAVAGKYGKAVLIQTFRGTATQEIGNAMIAAQDNRPGVPAASLDPGIIVASDQFRGIAAIYAICRAWSQLFESETPEFAAIVKGNNQIFDPRDDSTGYTANPALCTAWYLTAIMGFPWSTIDSEALIAAADHCDEEVELKAGGTEKRYECHGVITADMQHREVLSLLERSMAGRVRYASGKWFITAGAAPIAEPVDFTEASAQAGYKVLYDPPDRSLPNAVRGSYVDTKSWQPRAYPQRELPAAITAEGGPWWLDIDLPLTVSPSMAQRIAKIELLRARSRRRFSIELDLRGLAAQPGSIVTWSAPDIGMAAASFEVDAFGFTRRDGKRGGKVLGTRLDLVEWGESIFAWNPATDEKEGTDGVANPGGITPLAPTDSCYLEANLEAAGADFYAEYHISWTDPEIDEATLQHVRAVVTVTIKWDNAGSEDTTVATATEDVLPNVETLMKPIEATQAGWSYLSHEVTVTLAAHYSSGLASGPASLGLCEIPPSTYFGSSSAGTFPDQFFYELEGESDPTWYGSANEDHLVQFLVGPDLSILYDVDGQPIAELASGGPAGLYTATSVGESRFNDGNPWTFTFTLV